MSRAFQDEQAMFGLFISFFYPLFPSPQPPSEAESLWGVIQPGCGILACLWHFQPFSFMTAAFKVP